MKFKDMQNFFSRAVAPLKRKVLLMVGRAIITAVDDSKNIQELQISILADEVQEGVQHFQNYGFRSNPPKQTEAILLSIGGNRDNPVIIASENRNAKSVLPDLAEGESVWYHHLEEVYLQWKGKNLEGKADKIKIENENNEIISVLSELVQEILDSLTETALGPAPLTPATKARIQAVKDKLDTFKV